MPLYALDEEGRIVSAHGADPFRHYRCLECKAALHQRAGRERRSHFYHTQAVPQCRLYSQSIDHLVLQAALQGQNPALQAERPFEKILRIADLCWEEKKIVFEIQCSPIRPSEAGQRVRDYAGEGYELIWLLDDRLYNRRQLRLSEALMRLPAGYYFSLRRQTVYDQFEVVKDKARLSKGPPLPVDLAHPAPAPAPRPPMTRQLNVRTSSHYFPGDLFDRSLRYPVYLQRLQEQEEMILQAAEATNIVHLKKSASIGLEFLLRHAALNGAASQIFSDETE